MHFQERNRYFRVRTRFHRLSQTARLSQREEVLVRISISRSPSRNYRSRHNVPSKSARNVVFQGKWSASSPTIFSALLHRIHSQMRCSVSLPRTERKESCVALFSRNQWKT